MGTRAFRNTPEILTSRASTSSFSSVVFLGKCMLSLRIAWWPWRAIDLLKLLRPSTLPLAEEGLENQASSALVGVGVRHIFSPSQSVIAGSAQARRSWPTPMPLNI